MKFWKLPEGSRFSNKQLIAFLLPVLFEQLMVAGLGMADTFMVSSLGETAVAGVALVNRIDNFAKQFFVALAQGGSVVLSQYIGAQNQKSAQNALKNNIRIVVAIGLVIMLVMVLFKNQVLNLLFGGAEPEVLAISSTYFTVTAFSYPFIALYYSGSASFRAMGESKMPFAASVDGYQSDAEVPVYLSDGYGRDRCGIVHASGDGCCWFRSDDDAEASQTEGYAEWFAETGF